MKYSIVIPAYNEEKDIRKAIEDIKDIPDTEIIVVDDASTDRTAGILTDYPEVRVLHNEENRGHGYSVMRGLREAKGEYVIYIDADRQLKINDAPTGIDLKDYDFISGYRLERKDKVFRKIVSFCLRMTILFRHRMYIRDSNCPFKIYRREKLQTLLGAVPQTYIVPIADLEVLARKAGYRTLVVKMPHYPYDGIRKGFLQALNKDFFIFLSKAFREVVSL